MGGVDRANALLAWYRARAVMARGNRDPRRCPRASRQMSWWQRYAGAIAFIAVLIAGVVLYVLASNQVDQVQRAAHRAHLYTSQSNEGIVNAFASNCKQDRKFRVQYKRRGEAVIFLLHALAKQEKGVIRDRPRARESLQAVRQYENLIRIIPIPTCDQQIAKLNQAVMPTQKGK